MSDEIYTYDVNEFDAAGNFVECHRYVSSPGGSPIYAGTGSPGVAGPIAAWLDSLRAEWPGTDEVVSVEVHFLPDAEEQAEFIPLVIRHADEDIGYIAVGPEGDAVTEVTRSLNDLLDKKPGVAEKPPGT